MTGIYFLDLPAGQEAAKLHASRAEALVKPGEHDGDGVMSPDTMLFQNPVAETDVTSLLSPCQAEENKIAQNLSTATNIETEIRSPRSYGSF